MLGHGRTGVSDVSVMVVVVVASSVDGCSVVLLHVVGFTLDVKLVVVVAEVEDDVVVVVVVVVVV